MLTGADRDAQLRRKRSHPSIPIHFTFREHVFQEASHKFWEHLILQCKALMQGTSASLHSVHTHTQYTQALRVISC